MNNKQNNRFRCGVLDNYKVCDEEQMTASTNIEVIKDNATILPTDQILIIRKENNTTKIYKLSLQNISSDLAWHLLNKAIPAIPNCDQKDGSSIWSDQGTLKISSNPFKDF